MLFFIHGVVTFWIQNKVSHFVVENRVPKKGFVRAMRITILLVVIVLCISLKTTSCDFVYQYSNATNLEQKFQVNQTMEQIEDIFRNQILKQPTAIVYFDATWSIHSRLVQDIVESLFDYATQHSIPMYRFVYSFWFPESLVVKEWYEKDSDHNHSLGDDFDFQGFTKYRAVLFVLQHGKIKFQSMNIYFSKIDTIVEQLNKLLPKEEL